MKINLQLLPTF